MRAIEKSKILGTTIFSSERLNADRFSPAERRIWRPQWFERVLGALQGCDIVFADPDNGLCEDEKFRPGRKTHWKRIPLREAKILAENRSAVIYHHNTMRPGGHEAEIRDWIERLGANTAALRWRAFGARIFFLINPTPQMRKSVRDFALEWGPSAEYCE